MSADEGNIGTKGPFRYGHYWPNQSDLGIELICFRDDHRPENGGLGRAEHFWNIVQMLWGPNSPKPFLRHPWAEKMALESSKHKRLSVSGCGSSGKTDFFAVWGIVQWLCDPTNTLVLVTSTTIKESRRRIWGSIVDYWNALPDEVGGIGKLVDSYGLIKLNPAVGKASERCGITLIPGERKREKEAVGKFIGIKNKRVIVIEDEMPELSPAILQAALSNLTHNEYVQIIGLGNPASFFDAHGILSTPKDGWQSVTPRDFEWETIYGYAIRFDAELSPNITSGQDLYPFLPTNAKIAQAKKDLGDNSFSFWRMWKGFWCPEGSEDTVYSESEIFFYDANKEEIEWQSPPIPIAGLDAGYTSGGDRSIAYFALFGTEMSTGKAVLLFTSYVLIEDDPTNKKIPRNYQIVQKFKKLCQERGVHPSNAGVDVSGSPAFGDMVAREWTSEIFRMNFGGKSSKKAVGVDKLPADTVYGNRVTEIWFTARDYMVGQQIRGIGPDLAQELTARRYKNDGKIAKVEDKKTMKGRTGKSPDIADAALIVVELVRTRRKFKPSDAISRAPQQKFKAVREKALKPVRGMKNLIQSGGGPRSFSRHARGMNLIR